MIVLASQSPRRTALLSMLGIEHVVDPPHVDETATPGEAAAVYAARMARTKAAAVAARNPGELVLGADTIVVLDGVMLGKPASPAEAETMLAQLGGRSHDVVTAVALARDTELWERLDVTSVRFRSIDAATIREYVATGEPLDKAGAYGLQGRGGVLVERIAGDCFGVMGLPIRLVVELLEAAGQPYFFT